MTAASSIVDHNADWARPLYARQIDVLGELAETGMELARGIANQARAANDVETAQACAMAYGRVARAVRLTLLLQARFIKDLKAYDRNADHLTNVAGIARKAQVARIVERVVEAEAEEADRAEQWVGEVIERLDHDDIYGDVLSRPVSELVAMICKDLGLSPDWPRLADEAWAREEMNSGTVGWPLEAGRADDAPQNARDRIPFRSSA